MVTVKFVPSQRELYALKGTRLKDLCEEAQIDLPFGCGQGACGSCLIRVIENPGGLTPESEQERILLDSLGSVLDERLACQCKIVGDVVLLLPD